MVWPVEEQSGGSGGPETAGTNEPVTGERLLPVQGLSCGPCRLSRPEPLTTLMPARRHTGQVRNPSANVPLPAIGSCESCAESPLARELAMCDEAAGRRSARMNGGPKWGT